MFSAAKLKVLSDKGNRQIIFENNFIFEVARKLHPIIKASTEGIGNAFKGHLKADLSQMTTNEIDKFFQVKSTVAVWLK